MRILKDFIKFIYQIICQIIFHRKPAGKKYESSNTKLNKKKLMEMSNNSFNNEVIEDSPFDKEIPQNGFGTYTFPLPSGAYTYTGLWKNGLKHGKGVEVDALGRIKREGVWERGMYTHDKNGNEVNYDEIKETNTRKPKQENTQTTFSATGLVDIIEEMSKLGPLDKQIINAQSFEELKEIAMRLGITTEQSMVIIQEDFRRKISFPKDDTNFTERFKNEKITKKQNKVIDSYGTYEGYIQNGKKNGQGTMLFVSGNKYTGIWKDGAMHGQGTYTWFSGNFYEGEWKDDKKHGQGTMTWKNAQEQYKGEYKDDIIHGHGAYTYADGSKYVGEYEDGRRHGQATMTWANGAIYVGEYFDDNRHGQGALTDIDGTTNEGVWEKGEFINVDKENSNTLTYADGSKYVGETKNGTDVRFTYQSAHGQGTMIWANGNKYTGEWKDDNMHGQGTMIWANGDKYVGGFKVNERDGQGAYTYANGNKYVGEFKECEKDGQGTFTWYNGNIYLGEFKNDAMNGKGTITLSNGDKYVGEYKDGKRHGQGTFTSAAGNKYVGEYKDDKMHGKGTTTSADGKIMRLLFENDNVIKTLD